MGITRWKLEYRCCIHLLFISVTLAEQSRYPFVVSVFLQLFISVTLAEQSRHPFVVSVFLQLFTPFILAVASR
jgi:ACR3 family arsenite efflux pump ArsB